MPQKKNNSNQTKVSAERNGDKSQNAYFRLLELENIRCFSEKQKINFSDKNGKPKQWTIILGDNGTGKTTLLQSIITLLPAKDTGPVYLDSNLETEKNVDALAPKYAVSESGELVSKWIPHRFKQIDQTISIRKGKNKNSILLSEKSLKLKIDFFLAKGLSNNSLGKNNTLSFEFADAKGVRTFNRIPYQNVSLNCFAYGASRKAGETSISEQSEESTYQTLFDETALLINPEEWLLQADYASKRKSEFTDKRKRELELVKEILLGVPPEMKGALPEINDIRFSERERGRTPRPVVEFHTPYGWVESKDLSLGYRTSMAWIVDFASRMFDRYPESENPLAEPAVVLIDEIDLHLHPKWQRQLIGYLTNLFPNTQFIVTTHSPLIVQAAAARDANIVVCRREGDHVVIDQSVEAVSGWRADQILTSDLFDLPSTRDTHIEKLEKQRREILSKARLTKADESKLKTISAELDALPINEETEDDKAMDIIRRAAQYFQNEKT